uniref:Uncharacterized protein n=1 Tax=Rhizophora mucronata TaxID=61149 RepID=A0A2P2M5W3_RHIMU
MISLEVEVRQQETVSPAQ